MSRSDVEDPKLAEVKAILAKLQRISADDAPDLLPDAPPPAAAILATGERAGRATPPPLPAPAPVPAPSSRPSLPLTAMLAGAVAAAGVVYVAYPHLAPLPVPPPQVSAPPPAAVAPSRPPDVVATPVPAATPTANVASAAKPAPSDEKAGLQLAERMIGAGRLVEGREQLQAAGAERSADLAWALARAYDPNVVGAIAGADARPDVDEAARWYRRWHALAQAQGLVSDGVSVDRIIRAMQR